MLRLQVQFLSLVSRYKILGIAILISFLSHIFWLTAVKVVIAPNRTTPVKFSKVSFLGPVFESGGIQLKSGAAAFSFLEKRYFDLVTDARYESSYESSKENYPKSLHSKDFSRLHGDTFSAFIDEAVSGKKIEPVSMPE